MSASENVARELADEEVMAHLLALSPGACVKFSEWTGKWYVEASIEVGDGSILEGGTEHCDTPHEAIQAYFRRLTSVPLDKYIATRYRSQRREWRWNGAAFVEITREEALCPR